MRVLRGHKGAVTCIHAGTRSELGELMTDGDDVGYFVSGDVEGSVRLWDTSSGRGSEQKASMEGHRGAVRAIGSDSTRVISGGDEGKVLVHDKATSKVLLELAGHEGPISCLRMVQGVVKGSVVTAGRDGQVKMTDIRSGRVSTNLARFDASVLCMDYLDHGLMLAVAGTDGLCHLWDVRACREKYTLRGHSAWIRTVRMLGDAVLTGSDDWTARLWTLNDGQCEGVLACHSGPITALDFYSGARSIVTGSADQSVRLWERSEGAVRCVDTLALHSAPVRALKAGEKWLAVAAQDNSLSLFHRQAGEPSALEGLHGASSSAGDWQLRRSFNKAPDMVNSPLLPLLSAFYLPHFPFSTISISPLSSSSYRFARWHVMWTGGESAQEAALEF